MKTIKQIHQGFQDFEDTGKKGITTRQLFGKYQYIYSSDKGEISLVQFKNYFKTGDNFWEIYCLKGELFEDVEKFKTKKEAEKVIKKYLKGRL